MPNVCNVDGRIVAEAEATVPVLDRGFLFGDSVYEVTRSYGAVPFAWREHLARLRRSAEGIGMALELPAADLLRRVVATLEAATTGTEHGEDCYLRWIVTRGTGTAPSIGLEHAPGPQRVVILARPLGARRAATPLRLALVARPTAGADPSIKSGNYLANVVGMAEARRRGADDCLFSNAAGLLTEASTANVWLVFADGSIATPRPAAGLLAGITRGIVVAAAARAGIAVVERDLDRGDLQRATEAFLSGSLREIGPVAAVDDVPLRDPAPGPVTRRLLDAFAAEVADRRAADAAALRELLGDVGELPRADEREHAREDPRGA